MADPARGRSPSAGHQNNLRHTPSPSPHNPYRDQGLGVDHTLGSNTFANSFNDPTLTVDGSFGANDFLNNSQTQQQDSFTVPSDIAQHTFLQAQNVPQQGRASPLLGSNGDAGDDFTFDPTNGADNFSNQFYDDGVNGAEQGFLDPQLLGGDQNDASVNPTNLMSNMTTQHQTPTPPHMLHAGMDRRSVSPHVSPSMGQGPFQAPRHGRNTSLDPSSAAYPHGLNVGWGEGQQFSGHRRSPSDAYSDVSSTHNSPYLPTSDSFEQPIDHHSPLLNAQQDPTMFSNMGFENINISEAQAQAQAQQQHISPIPSPHISPRVGPQQQQLPQFTSADNFGLAPPTLPSQYIGQQEMFPSFQHNGGVDMGAGQANAMSPPEINIQPAPPSRQASFEPNKDVADGALSPPERSRSRNQNRMRAISDPYHGSSRPTSPANGTAGHVRNSLSPNSARAISRSPSPSSRAGNRRSSTSSVPNRDYILDLADPGRPQSNATGEANSPGRQRTQKHPATFQCSLCPKRFTRAYNLRSHLRTHTDERPFVCSVCGKAFARQHDRKRHEGLHSGEKRFVCRGHLKTGDNWGCGRKFARADALGRHFRSEAGRVCIKPLLEEEAAEKGGWDPSQGAMPDMQTQAMLGVGPGGMAHASAGGLMMQQPMAMPFQLPQVLYQQFPMLQGMNWDAMPAGDDMEEISGRSSFDASSGGEEFDDGYGGHGMAQGWASDQGGY